MQVVKGKIHSPDRARQLRDFSGLRFGSITPTDIDGLIEYKNLGYVILELKYGKGEVIPGQRLALERLTDDLERSGKRTLCVIATHDVSNCNESIDAANTLVTTYRHKGRWKLGKSALLTKDLVARFLETLEGRRKND